MINHLTLSNLIVYSIQAHALFPKKPSKAFRKWDGQTPYAAHSIWCATTILTESRLPEDLKTDGAEALLLHDVPEDTTLGLPEGLSERVIRLIEEMTFESSEQEMEDIWSKSREARLLKLYDKVSNLLDGGWMDSRKAAKYREYTRKLSEDVERNYGKLNIVRIAESIMED